MKKETNWVDRNKERVRSLQARAPRVTDEAKLQVLVTWKHWRRHGYEVAVVSKRLRVGLATVRKWAGELGFDLGKDVRKGAQEGEKPETEN